VEALNNVAVLRKGVTLEVTVECVMVVEGGATDDEDDEEENDTDDCVMVVEGGAIISSPDLIGVDDEEENDTDVKEGKVTDNVDMDMVIGIVMPSPRK